MPEGKSSQAKPLPDDFSRLYRFNGGLRLAEHREISLGQPIRFAGIPKQLVLPLQQHIGAPAECLVRTGDRVLAGDLLADPVGQVSAPVHTPASGTVTAIESRPVPHPSGLPATCIVIDTDSENPTGPAMAPVDYCNTDPAELCERIRQAGIVGLGGAGFPTRVKLGRRHDIELLVINGAECEPWISCDQSLMTERAADVIAGIRILLHILQPQQCVLAIEDNMPTAGQALRTALAESGDADITLVEITQTPTGNILTSDHHKCATGFYTHCVAITSSHLHNICPAANITLAETEMGIPTSHRHHCAVGF